MIKRFDGLRLWRRYLTTRWAVGAAVVTLLLSGALASGTFYVAHAVQMAGHSAVVKPPRPNPKAEGQWFQLSHFGKSYPAPDALTKARQQAARLPLSPLGGSTVKVQPSGVANAALAVGPGTWTALGPQPIDSNYNPGYSNNYGPNTGRITAIAVNPTNSQDVWIGAADGGLWHSTNGGASWTCVSDTSTVNGGPWPVLAIGAIAIAPQNPSIVYVGTGEGNANADGYWGAGVLRTFDGGATWFPPNSSFQYAHPTGISALAVDPTNTNTVLAAVVDQVNADDQQGIWLSTDAGYSWQHMLSNYTNSSDWGQFGGTSVLFDPSDPTGQTAYAGMGNVFGLQTNGVYGGVWKSTDAGLHWAELTNGIPTGRDVERVSLGISQDGSHLYAVLTDADVRNYPSEPSFGNLLNNAIYTSVDHGNSWTANGVTGVTGPMATDDGAHQWWYDSVVSVDPSDGTGNTAYVGGVDLWRTTNGGTNWSNVTNAYCASACPPPVNVHPDVHAVTFFGTASSSFYLGTDGGIWSSTTGGSSYSNLNGGGLNITQFYSGSIGDVGTGPELYGGTQDNGENVYPVGPISGPTTWNQVLGGDGGDTAVDFTNNLVVYGEFPYGRVYKSTNGGATWANASSGINLCQTSTSSCTPDLVNFIMPLAMSPNNHLELFAGTDRVYRSTNGASSWAAISPVLAMCNSLGCETWPLSAVTVAPSNESYIYAGDGHDDVYSSTDGGHTWRGVMLPAIWMGMVRGLAVDPTTPSTVYATVAGFAGQPGHHIFKSVDAGIHWTDISLNLPDVPFAGILVSPHDPNLLIAGSDVGVFDSPDGGTTWYQLGTGLPPVAMDQIFTNHAGTQLFVATHGRGMWQLDLPEFTATPTSVETVTTPGTSPNPQTLTISNTGFSALNWTLTSALPSWLALSDNQGAIGSGGSRSVAAGGSDPITLSFSGIATGTYNTTLTFSDPNAANQSISVPVTVVAAAVSKTWYFAEGHTGGSFTEWLTLANPNAVTATVQVTYYLGSGTPVVKSYLVSPNARRTLDVNTEIGTGQNVSLVVTSDQPVVAERPMYFTYTGLPGYTIPGGSDVLGATALTTSFDFGYLDTSSGHATWLTILNQNASDMTVSIRYFNASGVETDRTHTVAANSRGTVYVNSEGLAAGSYSALVSLSAPGLVERPLYLKDSTTGNTGSADVVGVAQPSSAWYFAEGYSSASFSERYIVSNPNPSATAAVTLTYLGSNGNTVQDSATIAPGAQHVFLASAKLGSGGVNNSAVVTAVNQADGTTPLPVLAERFMSFDYGGRIPGASDVLGATTPTQLYYFAEGYTGGSFSEYLTIENPSPSATATVEVTFLPQNGGAPTVRWYTVGPDSRFTLNTAAVMPSQSFSMQVLADVPIVAERPMYFDYAGTQTGGTDVVGYQP